MIKRYKFWYICLKIKGDDFVQTNIYREDVKIKHLLKADPFSQKITILDRNNNFHPHDLVEDTSDFFRHLYINANGQFFINNNLCDYSFENFMNRSDFSNPANCMLYIIEGYAGCGKSTLVQYILYTVFNQNNFEYSYYNYDIGARTADEKTVESQVKNSILINLLKQIFDIIEKENGIKILKKFFEIIDNDDLTNIIDSTRRIKTDFSNTKVVISTIDELEKCKDSKLKEKIFCAKRVFEGQLIQLDIYQLLCLDYLWRLSQYIISPTDYRKYMFVCYDNLDSIFDYNVLCEFKETLISFCIILNEYIAEINRLINNGNTKFGKYIPQFVIFTTFRKITASRSITNNNRETYDDMLRRNESIVHLEVSNLYNFTEIASARVNHFSAKIEVVDICGDRAICLKKQLSLVNSLKNMNFVKEKYAGIWNYNFRACSNVLNEIIENDENEVNQCIKLASKKMDGFNADKSCYHGASSVFLHSICKVLYINGIFDKNHLDLINLKEDTETRKTALSRLILTYLNNRNTSVSITDLIDVFGRTFSIEYICTILAQMLKRSTNEIWRRPIYYSKNAFENEVGIYERLLNQCNDYLDNRASTNNYVEFRICECGKAFIEEFVPNFEFYSIRIDKNNKPLYCIENPEEIEGILKKVHEKIVVCCKKQVEFKDEYCKAHNISLNEYLELPFHPKTKSTGNYQLHIERTIFSHTAYFEQCIEYYKTLFNKNTNKINEFKEIFQKYYKEYLRLYDEFIAPVSNQRQQRVNIMKEKIKKI